MSAQANAASRQGMLFGDPLEGLDTDEVAIAALLRAVRLVLRTVSSITGLAPVSCSRRSVPRAALARSVSTPSVTFSSSRSSRSSWTPVFLSSRFALPCRRCRTGEWMTLRLSR